MLVVKGRGHECEYGQCDQHRQCGASARDFELLLGEARRAQQQTHAHDAVADDHDGCEQRIARKVSEDSPPAIMSETISEASMTVIAQRQDQCAEGLPTRCATTSAWCTPVNTAPSRMQNRHERDRQAA